MGSPLGPHLATLSFRFFFPVFRSLTSPDFRSPRSPFFRFNSSAPSIPSTRGAGTLSAGAFRSKHSSIFLSHPADLHREALQGPPAPIWSVHFRFLCPADIPTKMGCRAIRAPLLHSRSLDPFAHFYVGVLLATSCFTSPGSRLALNLLAPATTSKSVRIIQSRVSRAQVLPNSHGFG